MSDSYNPEHRHPLIEAIVGLAGAIFHRETTPVVSSPAPDVVGEFVVALTLGESEKGARQSSIVAEASSAARSIVQSLAGARDAVMQRLGAARGREKRSLARKLAMITAQLFAAKAQAPSPNAQPAPSSAA